MITAGEVAKEIEDALSVDVANASPREPVPNAIEIYPMRVDGFGWLVRDADGVVTHTGRELTEAAARLAAAVHADQVAT
jgi:hypothetical protein